MASALLFFAFLAAVFIGWGLFGGVIKLIMALLLWMFIGNIAGYMIRGEDYGVAGNIALGLLGGVVGAFVLRMLGFGGLLHVWLLGPIISGLLGAMLVIYLARWTIDGNFGK